MNKNFNKHTREDTTVLIWDNLYRVRVPQLALRSEEELRCFGMRITGDPGIDNAMANQLTDIMIPIVKMVEYHSTGVSVRIVNQADVKTIYDDIQKHIEGWAANIQNNFNIGNVPHDDLLKMNEFAQAIFGHAKVHYLKGDTGSNFFRYLDSLPHAINKQPDASTLTNQETVELMEETTRPDFGDLFAKAAENNRGRRWS